MPVLIESWTLLIQADALREHYPGGIDAFARAGQADRLCGDDELVAVGFDDLSAGQELADELETLGLRHLVNSMAVDFVFAEPRIGLHSPCGWAEHSHVEVGGNPEWKVACGASPGGDDSQLIVPAGWRYPGSRSERLNAVAAQLVEDEALTLLRIEGDEAICFDAESGEEVAVPLDDAPSRGGV